MWRFVKEALRALQGEPTPAKPLARKSRLEVVQLEDRAVPAVASFNAATGALTVDMTRNVQPGRAMTIDYTSNSLVRVRDNSGQPGLYINGAKNGQVLTTQVKSINVIGSELGDTIDLSRVNTKYFFGLDGKINVTAKGGSDTVWGSWFADKIDGGNGDDYLHGGDGKDLLNGGADNDYLYGEEKDDILTGGSGADYFSGGSGKDQATDYNRSVDKYPYSVEIGVGAGVRSASVSTLVASPAAINAAFETWGADALRKNLDATVR